MHLGAPSTCYHVFIYYIFYFLYTPALLSMPRGVPFTLCSNVRSSRAFKGRKIAHCLQPCRACFTLVFLSFHANILSVGASIQSLAPSSIIECLNWNIVRLAFISQRYNDSAEELLSTALGRPVGFRYLGIFEVEDFIWQQLALRAT